MLLDCSLCYALRGSGDAQVAKFRMGWYYKFVTGELRDAYSGTVDYTKAIGKWLTLPENEIDRNGDACGRGFHLMKIPKPYLLSPIYILVIGLDCMCSWTAHCVMR